MELASIISILKARKMIKKEHTAYLAAYVVDTQAIKNDSRSVSIVYEYLDMFYEEKSGLPLKREIEFTIEVVPEKT